MTSVRPPKTRRRIFIGLILSAAFVFWFVTAPAGMAIERIVSGGNGGTFARLIDKMAYAYEAPMFILGKIPLLKHANESLAQFWCDFLGAPETTP